MKLSEVKLWKEKRKHTKWNPCKQWLHDHQNEHSWEVFLQQENEHWQSRWWLKLFLFQTTIHCFFDSERLKCHWMNWYCKKEKRKKQTKVKETSLNTVCMIRWWILISFCLMHVPPRCIADLIIDWCNWPKIDCTTSRSSAVIAVGGFSMMFLGINRIFCVVVHEISEIILKNKPKKSLPEIHFRFRFHCWRFQLCNY